MFLTSCTSVRNINGKNYEPKGLFTTQEMSKDINYNVSPGNVALSIIFIETVVVPIVLIGFYLYQPIDVKDQ
jgi:hypothetical protein